MRCWPRPVKPRRARGPTIADARLRDPDERRPRHVALWIVRALLALAFAGSGALTLYAPIAELATKGMRGWVVDSAALRIRFIGARELLGALGLVARVAPLRTVGSDTSVRLATSAWPWPASSRNCGSRAAAAQRSSARVDRLADCPSGLRS